MSRCEGKTGGCTPSKPLEEVLGYETGWKDAVISYPDVFPSGSGDDTGEPTGNGFTTTVRMTFDIPGLYGKLSAIDVGSALPSWLHTFQHMI